MSTRIITISHLARNALQDWARCALDSEQNEDGTHNVVMSGVIVEAFEQGADAAGEDVSDYILHTCRTMRRA